MRVKIRVSEVFGGRRRAKEDTDTEVGCVPGGLVFVRGASEVGMYNSNASRAGSLGLAMTREGGDGEIRVLLAGLGGARGKGGVRVREGSVVGVRAPMWDVDVGVGGGRWVIGVEWVVLS